MNSQSYFKSESSVQGAVSTIYYTAAMSYAEFFWYLQEFSADQIAWRSWNGGAWGWDDATKFVLSSHSWNSESLIIEQTWAKAWETIGLCNNLIYELRQIDPSKLGMTAEKVESYISETRTLRAWAYYNIFEIWGGALPLNVKSASESSEMPKTAHADFDESCKIIYNFISTELDESVTHLPKNQVNRMNQAANRILKARLLLNSEVFVKEAKYTECATLCQSIINGDFGTYSLADDHTDIYSIDNVNCPEVVMAFACEAKILDIGWMRVMPFVSYNVYEYMGGSYEPSAWNCVCLAPSYDNTGTVNPTGGSTGAKCFLDEAAGYGDKLGAVYERFDDNDIRKAPFRANVDGSYSGMFLMGLQKNYAGTEVLKADADRDGQDLVYVDQLGTFMNKGKQLQPVMNPRWGETNSGYRLVKYPIYPEAAGIDFTDIDEVEFRLSEVYYMLAECKLRAGSASEAQDLVKEVKKRYFANPNDALNRPMGFDEADEDWMLHEWGIEFLGEGRRRRTDLRRFDKFTQGQWWFFGRIQPEEGRTFPAVRDRKYEWFPLPQKAITANPGLIQNPNYL